MVTVNSIDEQIARLLGKDGRQNSEALAKQLNISSATVRRRLRKLTQSGLLRIVGVVEPDIFGLPLIAMIALNVSPDKLESALEVVAKLPEIRWVSTSTGRFDIIAQARFRSTDHLSDFQRKELAKMEGLKNIETFICLDVKKGPYIILT